MHHGRRVLPLAAASTSPELDGLERHRCPNMAATVATAQALRWLLQITRSLTMDTQVGGSPWHPLSRAAPRWHLPLLLQRSSDHTAAVSVDDARAAIDAAAEVYHQAAAAQFANSSILHFFHANFVRCFLGDRDLELQIIDRGLACDPSIDIRFMLLQSMRQLEEGAAGIATVFFAEDAAKAAAAAAAATSDAAHDITGGHTGEQAAYHRMSIIDRWVASCACVREQRSLQPCVRFYHDLLLSSCLQGSVRAVHGRGHRQRDASAHGGAGVLGGAAQ